MQCKMGFTADNDGLTWWWLTHLTKEYSLVELKRILFVVWFERTGQAAQNNTVDSLENNMGTSLLACKVLLYRKWGSLESKGSGKYPAHWPNLISPLEPRPEWLRAWIDPT
jgi:hypothetical protein